MTKAESGLRPSGHTPALDKFYAKALENLAENGYHKVDFDHLTKEEEHLWKKYFQSELFPILSPQIVDNRHPFPFLRNKEIYLGVLLKEKHTQEQSLGIVPISSQMERMHFIKKGAGAGVICKRTAASLRRRLSRSDMISR